MLRQLRLLLGMVSLVILVVVPVPSMAGPGAYQVVDLGQLYGFDPFSRDLTPVGIRPEAISDDGTIVGWKAVPQDTLQWHVAVLRAPDGTQRLLGNFQGDCTQPMAVNGPYVVGIAGLGGCFSRSDKPLLWSAEDGFSLLPPVPDGAWGQASGVNAQGNAVGWSVILRGPEEGMRPILWLDDVPVVLSGHGRAWAINNSGVVVGQSDGHATRWTAEGAARLDLPDTLSSTAVALNDHGTIAGDADTAAGTTQAFVWLEDGGFLLLPLPPGDLHSQAIGVQGDGVVFGRSWHDGTSHVVRWYPVDGQIVVEDLQPLLTTHDLTLVSIEGVNAGGAVVGLATDPAGHTHGVLLEPLPTGLASAD